MVDLSIPDRPHLVHTLVEPELLRQVQDTAETHGVTVVAWLRHAMRQVTPEDFAAGWHAEAAQGGMPRSHDSHQYGRKFSPPPNILYTGAHGSRPYWPYTNTAVTSRKVTMTERGLRPVTNRVATTSTSPDPVKTTVSDGTLDCRYGYTGGKRLLVASFLSNPA